VDGDVLTRELAAWTLFVVVTADTTDQILDVLGPGYACTAAGPTAPSYELAGVLAEIAQSTPLL